jgi:hypothetical protein
MTTYRYSISYISIKGASILTGRIDMNLPAPITNAADVNEIERGLRAHTADPQVHVQGFSLYTDPQGR